MSEELTFSPSSIDLSTKISEAEAYHAHGLYEEAHQIYESILSDATDIPEDIKDSILDRINALEAHINDASQFDKQMLTAEDVTIIKGAWSAKSSAPEIIASADSFIELEMYKEALSEYKKLFALNHPVNEIADMIAECVLKLDSSAKAFTKVDELSKDLALSPQDIFSIKIVFGNKLQEKGQSELALEFLESAKLINPNDAELDDKIKKMKGEKQYDSRYGYLLDENIVTTTQLQNALGISKKGGKSVEFILAENYRIKKEEIGKSLALFYKCKFRDFDPDIQVPYELIRKLKKTFLVQNTWVPISWDLNKVDVLIDNPADIIKTDQIPSLIGAKKISFHVGIKEDIEAYISLFYDSKPEKKSTSDTVSDNENFDMLPDIEFEDDDEHIDTTTLDVDESSSQIVKMVDHILVTAYRRGASDIHIEPSPVTKKTGIRYRIDGVCQEILQVPNSSAKALISRIKILANLNIAEKRMPQDGKIKFNRKGVKPFELRVATLPTAGGFEDAVLRILAESGAMKLNDMGMTDRNLEVLKRIIQQPYGLILVVGPTGSGKTTTLHSALGHINKPGIKIWTAEDPVEITQQGLRQVECKSEIGLNFARIMRAFLRADPDVIMIGEMRDHETASIGIEASLTGHLVLSTLHTNSAPETITRLLDMGLNPLNFSDAFLGVLAQRLVRKLCNKCKKSYNPSREEFSEIVSLYGAKYFEKAGIKYKPDMILYRPSGCEDCNNSGYRGRMGIHEMLEGTKDVKLLIKKAAPTENIFQNGAEQGMTTLLQDGLLKVFAGFTDVNEIRRVCVS